MCQEVVFYVGVKVYVLFEMVMQYVYVFISFC